MPGTDPQFQCSPASDHWKVFKTLDTDEIVIVFTPNGTDEGKTFTFILASNTEKKTNLSIHLITVGIKEERKPKVGKYDERLTTSYSVSPDKPNLLKLIKTLETVKNSTAYSTLEEMAELLKSQSVLEGLGDAKSPILRKVRDEIKQIITEEFGTDNSKDFDVAKFKITMGSIVTSLNKLKGN